MNRRRAAEWSVMLFVVGLLAFSPPFLSIFSVPELFFGIPTLYFYIFVAWGLVIALLAFNVSKLTEQEVSEPLRMPGPLPATEEIEPPLSGDLESAPRRDRTVD